MFSQYLPQTFCDDWYELNKKGYTVDKLDESNYIIFIAQICICRKFHLTNNFFKFHKFCSTHRTSDWNRMEFLIQFTSVWDSQTWNEHRYLEKIIIMGENTNLSI
jgi:hypothetical protein